MGWPSSFAHGDKDDEAVNREPEQATIEQRDTVKQRSALVNNTGTQAAVSSLTLLEYVSTKRSIPARGKQQRRDSESLQLAWL